MNFFSLSLTALLPAVLLCVYVYLKDRVEKEPVGLLAILFAAGAVAFFPAVLGEELLVGLADRAFASRVTYSLTGVAEFESELWHMLHSGVCGFFAVALVEEGVKWLLLFFITRNNKNFSHLFDGVVYSVVISLGFAVSENLRHGFMDGWGTFLMRVLTSIPAHMTFGVIMGFFYTLWNAYNLARIGESRLAGAGVITVKRRFPAGIILAGSIAAPVLTHGFYSFIRLYTSDAATDVFYVYIAVTYILCLVAIHRLSDADSHEDTVARRLILAKYPEAKASPDFGVLTAQNYAPAAPAADEEGGDCNG